LINVALAGLGWWGRTMTPLLEKSSKLKLVRMVDPNAAAAAGFAKEHGVPFSASLEDALADPSVQAVILATPHTLHCEQIVQAASAGKHVFCEKPLCMSRAEVLRATAAVNANRVKLAVGHERRFEPPTLALMRAVSSGEIGTPLQFEANFSQDKFLTLTPDNWRMSQKEAPAGPMTATGIHLLDLSVGIFGPAESVLARVKQLGSQLTNGDTLGMLISYKRGGHALISAILATPFDGRLAVYGSHGWIEVRDKAHPESPEGWTLTKTLRGGKPKTTEYPVAAPVLANLEAFADDCEGRAPYPVPQDQMIANVSLLEAAFKSAASGRIEMVEG
jgi:predicted dehydrogenase